MQLFDEVRGRNSEFQVELTPPVGVPVGVGVEYGRGQIFSDCDFLLLSELPVCCRVSYLFVAVEVLF